MIRAVPTTSQQIADDTYTWVQKLLSRQPVVDHGFQFCWNDVSSSAYMFEASMRYIQMAQHDLLKAQTMLGAQAYKTSLKAAKHFAFVMTDIMPKWTFQPFLLCDTIQHDVYGHYCLARAVAYDSVGKADLNASKNAQMIAAANAAHLFAVAAHLINGDVTECIRRAYYNTGKVLQLRAEEFMNAWQNDTDDLGAAKACACLDEADLRYRMANEGNCLKERMYAHERNQVHWQAPVLPPWNALMRVQITHL